MSNFHIIYLFSSKNNQNKPSLYCGILDMHRGFLYVGSIA